MFYFFLTLAIVLCFKTCWNLAISPCDTIERLRFVVFLKFFANSLMISFFPQYVAELVRASHLPMMMTSVSYVIYQVAFLMMLIPGGYWAEVRAVKKLLLGMSLIEAFLFLSFGLIHSIWFFLLLQLLFGLIIPISSSAEYAYLLHYSNEENRAEGFAKYSNSLKGAMIAGVVFGGLLLHFIGNRHLFFISAAIILIDLIFILLLLPHFKPTKQSLMNRRHRYESFRFVFSQLPKLIKRPLFVRKIFGVGLTIGLIDDGVVLFSIPLLLSYYHVSHDRIAQLLVLVTIGFFASNRFIARYADRFKWHSNFVRLGFIGVVLSLCAMAFSTHNELMLILSIGLLLLGLFKGFILSPASAAIVNDAASHEIGKNVVLSLFRVCQMMGSIAGPIILLSLFEKSHYRFDAYIIVAILILFLGVLSG